MIYATLGNLQFEPLPLTELSEKHAWQFAEHQVIEGKPLLQYIGSNLDETRIKLRFHFSFCSPSDSWNDLKVAADKREAMPLVMANGDYYGMRVIIDIARTMQQTADNGNLLVLELELTLKEWAEPNKLLVKKQQAKKKAKAVKKQGKKPVATKKKDVPQLTKESRAAGYKIVNANQIVKTPPKA
jgi:phage protein U